MIKVQLGQLIDNSKLELSNLKQQLNFVRQLMEQQESEELIILFKQLSQNIERLEARVQVKVEQLFNNIIAPPSQTVQKLPILRSRSHIDDPSPIKADSTSNVFQEQRSRLFSVENQRDRLKIVNTIAPYIKLLTSKNLDPRGKPIGKDQYMAKKLFRPLKQGRIAKTYQINRSVGQQGDLIQNQSLNQSLNESLNFSSVKINTTHQRGNSYNIKNDFETDITKYKSDFSYNFDMLPSRLFLQYKNPKFSLETSDEIKAKQLGQNQVAIQSTLTQISADIPVQRQTLLDQKVLFINDLKNRFRFTIIKGKRQQSQRLESLQTFNHANWSKINTLIDKLESVMSQCQVVEAIIDGKKLQKLANSSVFYNYHIEQRVTLSELLTSIVNKDIITSHIQIYLKDKIFKGRDGYQLTPYSNLNNAASKIQALYRGFKARKQLKSLQDKIKGLRKIQMCYRRHRALMNTRMRLHQNSLLNYEAYLQRQEDFKLNWPITQLQARVEIHVPSYSFQEYTRLTMEMFLQRQNQQITRIFRSHDYNVQIVYICAFDMDEDVLAYYDKIFQMNGINNFTSRVKFLTPEAKDKFPSHFSTLQTLLYSPKCLSKLKQLIKHKTAFIVPSCNSNEYVRLSCLIEAPIYGGVQQKHMVSSLKSGARGIFNACEIPVAPGAIEIYDEIELFNTLTVLIINNPDVKTWIFKTDNTFGGRGIAWFSIDCVRGIKQILAMVPQNDIDETTIAVMRNLLQSVLPQHLKIAVQRLHNNYREYMAAFYANGGIIEASPSKLIKSQIQSPSIFFDIKPNGEIQVLGSFDRISGQPFINVAYSFPQTSMKSFDLKQICQTLGANLYQKGIYGFTSVDLLVFNTNKNFQGQTKILFWAIGLDCFLNDLSSSFFYFEFLTLGKLNQITGEYFIPLVNPQPNAQFKQIADERSYLYCPFIVHPGLTQTHLRTFFQMCRLDNISYDIDEKQGQSFILSDIVQSGFISFMTIGHNFKQNIKLMSQSFAFIVKLAGQVNLSYGETMFESRNDQINLSDIYGKIKCLEKGFDKMDR